MIQVRIREMCERRGIDTPYRLQIEAGLTPTLASSLFHHTFKQLSMATLNRLCMELRCQPAQLLHFEPDPKDVDSRVLGRHRKKT
jgi:DNA-binding Xre family transcriptional regulator